MRSLLGVGIYDAFPNVRELLELTGLTLPEQPTHEDMQHVFAVWGKQAAFAANAPGVAAALSLDGTTLPSDEVLDLLVGTGLLDSVELRNIRGITQDGYGAAVDVILSGKVANWMQECIEELCLQVNDGTITVRRIHALGGGRVCNLDSEVNNPAVVAWQAQHGGLPTEIELQKFLLKQTGLADKVTPHDGGELNLEMQVARLAASATLSDLPIYVPANGGAGHIPLKVRRVLRDSLPGFDEDGSGFWYSQSGKGLARTPAEAADPKNHQRPLTFFSELARYLWEIWLLNNH